MNLSDSVLDTLICHPDLPFRAKAFIPRYNNFCLLLITMATSLGIALHKRDASFQVTYSSQGQPKSNNIVDVGVQRSILLATTVNTSEGLELQSSTGDWWGLCWKYITIQILPFPIPSSLTLLLVLSSIPSECKCPFWSLFPGGNELWWLVLGNRT